MEYVLVRTSDEVDRPVWIDDQQSGRTEVVLEVEKGTHTFALCACPEDGHEAECPVTDCQPTRKTVEVFGTFRIRPLEVDFACNESQES